MIGRRRADIDDVDILTGEERIRVLGILGNPVFLASGLPRSSSNEQSTVTSNRSLIQE